MFGGLLGRFMRLGGFVIHSNAAGTIAPCLDSLAAVCDRLVSVDTGSTDGTATLAAASGFTVLPCRWEGYGAARVEAVRALQDCDWVIYLDSDEWLGPGAIEAILRLKANPPDAPCVALPRRNWAEFGGRRFVYQHEHPVRLARRGHARFDRRMIIHEAIPPGPTVSLDAVIEHGSITSIEALRSKLGRYALLWALRQDLEGRSARSPALQWAIHMVRDLVLRGAALTGRLEAFQIAAAYADYHASKYALLREVRAGHFAALATLLREDRLEDLFRTLPDVEPELKTWAPWTALFPARTL
jgi:glycosyltransferase involved in cell wall biosynthesis